ncbi:putative p1 ISBm1 [Brucella pseudogrignonensis]|uniref:Putative p1 ISBm1 n=1 Tax=Brucella pseudogrignonensis TaxID=419475 RepID=A0A256G875_9HYPH|nr:putative p1 ISBm1 [Brucella pseudogrignonensis]
MVLNVILLRSAQGHHGPKSLNAMVLQRAVTAGSFVGDVLLSGIDCPRPMMATS